MKEIVTPESLFKTYQQLERALKQLSKSIVETDAELSAVIYQLPMPLRDAKPQISIEPKRLFKMEARQHAAKVLQALTIEPEQHSCGTWRAPGHLQSSQETLDWVNQVNTLKEAFKEQFKLLEGDRNRRHMSFAEHVSYFSYKQITRKIVCYEKTINKMMFNWVQETDGIHRKEVKDIRQELAKEQYSPASKKSLEDWTAMREWEDNQFAQYTDTHAFAKRTTLHPYPIVNVYTPERIEHPKRKFDKCQASLPVFYSVQANPEEVPVKPLPIMDRRFKRATRSDVNVKSEPYIERLKLYEYMTQPPARPTKAKN